MSKQIWKFGITVDLLSIEMPKGARPLCVQMQMNIPCLWAIVDPSQEKEFVKVDIYGTGHDIPDNPGEYIGTFQVADGKYVFHLFIPAK